MLCGCVWQGRDEVRVRGTQALSAPRDQHLPAGVWQSRVGPPWVGEWGSFPAPPGQPPRALCSGYGQRMGAGARALRGSA